MKYPGAAPFAIVNRWKMIDGQYQDFTCSGALWEKSPVSGIKVTKQFDDTFFWIKVFGDLVPLETNPGPDNYFAGVFIDGVDQASVALVALPAKDITFTIDDFVHTSAGAHTFDLMVGSGGLTRAVYQFKDAWVWHLMEVKLPDLSKIG